MVNNIDTSAEGGRMELDPIELKLANLKLAGQVLDADDKPVAGVNVMLYGEGQANGNSTTDRQGRFRFEHVCDGPAQLQANSQSSFGSVSAQGGETNVLLRLGQQMGNAMPGSKSHKVHGTVTDADGKPIAGAELTVFPSSFGNPQWTKADANGAYHLTWSLEPWQAQQSGGTALLMARDRTRNLAGTEELPEDTTNLDIKLKPALTVAGRVSNPDDSPLAGANVSVMLKAGNTYGQLGEQPATCNAQGRYEVKCLPPDGQYLVYASAKGHGQNQRQFQGDPETNRMELPPFVLNLADRVLAGQVLNENDKPVSGAMVQLNGDGQPSDNMSTDSKGRFHFKVCEGQVRLFANSPQGGGFAQATAEAGDTNVVINLSAQPGMVRQAPHRAALQGSPLPDLTTVSLAANAAPAGQAVLLCLFDAGQRSSRHFVHQLDEEAAALRQQNVTVLGIQAAVTSDQILNDWKSASPVSFPLGRVADKSQKSKWAADAPALPWLILADASHHVVAEGFALDELDAQIKKLAK
jgi:protocatechuate 3,4-dioxygenase beta subunit